ncbi:alpha/beta-hydrolase [Fistulina hepatica ATCC 64428]|uniref:Alpha/beta-hydrolase n=1 Tax=Fistulina hepatica ATCC 64428 TaxID=1128425 RepID=A0A0D7AAV0_9AGAR|nr:alpha/beta-hydrolase [Fistulina hepatica ATCC 64428]
MARCLSTNSVETVDLSYNSFIPPDGNQINKPLVILHGLFGSKRNWLSLSKAFMRDVKRPVYALDLRNHGESPHKAPMTYVDMAADVTNFLHEHSLRDITLIGHSMGGKVAMAVALSSSLPSGTLETLIVEDIAPVKGRLDGDFIKYVKAMKRVEQSNVSTRKEVIEILGQAEKTDQRSPTKDPAVLQFLSTNIQFPPAVEKLRFIIPLDILEQYVPSLGDFPYDPTENQWSGPTLFVKGEHSRFINDRNVGCTKEFFPNSEVVSLPTGHWVHAQRPHDFKDVVLKFMREHSKHSS